MPQKPKHDNEEGLLVSAAKTIGEAAGKIAAATGARPEPQPQPDEQPKPRNRRGRLPPKNKSRLPRRQKKQAKKQQGAAQTHSAAS